MPSVTPLSSSTLSSQPLARANGSIATKSLGAPAASAPLSSPQSGATSHLPSKKTPSSTTSTSLKTAHAPHIAHASSAPAGSEHARRISIAPAVPNLTAPLHTTSNGSNALSAATATGAAPRASVPASDSSALTSSSSSSSPPSRAVLGSQIPTRAGPPTPAAPPMQNGAPTPGSKHAAGNGIQFGSIPAGASPSTLASAPVLGSSPAAIAGNALNVASGHAHRASPSPSPSPIPQPQASGGRPPSSMPQNNGLAFGSISGSEDLTRSSRTGLPANSLTPNASSMQLRRDSSQSSHPDVGNGVSSAGAARGGYGGPQGGRGRGYPPAYGQTQMPYSPNPNYRHAPNAPRGNPNMSAPFPAQAGRPMGPTGYPHSPHQAARSPSVPIAQPMHPQGGQMPGPNGQIPPTPYGGFPNQMSPHQNQYYQFDPNYGYYAPPYGVQPGVPPFGIPPSPRPPVHMQQPGQVSQYMPGQPHPGQSMSRTPSTVSERPASAMGGHPPQTPMTPATSQMSHQTRSSQSPAPSKPGNNFQVPVRKAAAIVIRDPKSGAVKTFDKVKTEATPTPTAPAPSTKTTTPEPTSATAPSKPAAPPSTTTAASRSDKAPDTPVKTDDEKRRDMKEAIERKLREDGVVDRRLQDQKEAQEESQAQAQHAAENADAKATEANTDAAAAADATSAAKPSSTSAATDSKAADLPSNATSTKAAVREPSPAPADDDDEYWARIEAEEAEREREMERKYQEKKKKENEAKAAQAAEKAARMDEDLKRLEREAEAREEAKAKAAESGATTDAGDNKSLFDALKKSDNAFKATQTPPIIETPAESGAATPNSTASSAGLSARKGSAADAPPAGSATRPGSKPSALKLETSKPVEPPQPSAALQSLRTARFLTTITEISYPTTISSPNPALNAAAPPGKFRYDKTFLLQFQHVFTEKPSENWSEKLRETVGDSSETPGTARPRNGGVPAARQPSHRNPGGLSGGSFAPANVFGQFSNARTLPAGTTSQARFEASTQGGRPGAGGPMRYNAGVPGGFPMPFAPAMSRTQSSGSMNHPQSPRTGTSHRGSHKGSKGGKRPDTERERKEMPLTAGQDLKPIEVTEGGWKPMSLGVNAHAGPPPGGDGGYLAPDVVQRKVKAMQNKMTPTTFDKISGQIIDIMLQSKKETDGRTLRQVIQLTFEKATDEAHWAQMYAELCQRMMASMTAEIKDETLGLDKNGNVNAGVSLFRKYLLNRCQQDFEAGWKSKLPDKPEDEAGESQSKEAAMLSDEYYAAAAAKRRGLGLVRFIGELFKLGMLTSRIMHMCVKRLVDYEGVPDEAEVESLTSLLKTIGENLDSEEKGRPSMDAYFARINSMIQIEALPSRLKFMLLDIVDLRKKGWKSKDVKGPSTIEEVRARAAAEEREREMQRLAEQSRRSGGGGSQRFSQGRGDVRNFSGPNSMMPPPQSNTVGLDELRRLTRGGSRQASSNAGPAQAPPSFGPTSMFSNARGSNPRRSMAAGATGGPGGLLSRGLSSTGIAGAAGSASGEGESGATSRTGTPPVAKKDDKETTSHANAFSALATLDSEANDATSAAATSPPASTASSPSVTKAKPSAES